MKYAKIMLGKEAEVKLEDKEGIESCALSFYKRCINAKQETVNVNLNTMRQSHQNSYVQRFYNRDSPEISGLFVGVWLECQMFHQSIDDLFRDLRWNSVCACVHPERLMNSQLVDDGVKLRTVTDLLTHLCKVVLDAYPGNIGVSEGWSDFSGQHLEDRSSFRLR